MRLTALPSASTTPSQIVPPTSVRAGGGEGSARWGSIRAARPAAWPVESSRSTGTSRNAGSARSASRSAKASLAASSWRWIHAGSDQPRPPNRAPARRREPLEDVEDLERDHAAAVGRVGGDPDAAVGRRDRAAPGARGARAGPRACAVPPAAREARGDPLAEVAVVVGVEPLGRRASAASRRGPGAGSARRAATAAPARRQICVEAARPRLGAEPPRRALDRARSARPRPGTRLGLLDRRGQHRVPRQPAPAAVRVGPRADGARAP